MASSRKYAERASARGNLGGGSAPLQGRWSFGQVGAGADGFYEPRSCVFLKCCMAPDHGAHWQTTEEIRVHDGEDDYFEDQVERFIKEFCPNETHACKEDMSVAVDAMKHLDATAFAKSILDITCQEARHRIHDQAHDADCTALINNTHFVLTSFHDRDDIYHGRHTGEKYLSTFGASVLLRNYTLPMEDTPPHVPMRNIEEFIESVSTVTPDSDGNYNIASREARQIVYDRVREIDWSAVTASVYCPCPWPNGVWNAPAWNSLWIIRNPPKEGEEVGEMVLWSFVSATAQGKVATYYVSTEFDTWYESWPDFKFTPLARPDNIYRYRLQRNPLQLTIQVYYKEFPPNVPIEETWSGTGEFDGRGNRPMLQVHSVLTPALNKTVADFYAVKNPSAEKMRQVLVKGCLMYDLMRLYEPDKADNKLFTKIALEEASDLEAFTFGGVMNLLSDFENWRGALWMIPPDKEPLAMSPRKSVRAKDDTTEARQSHIGRLQDLAFDLTIEASMKGNMSARRSLMEHAGNERLTLKLAQIQKNKNLTLRPSLLEQSAGPSQRPSEMPSDSAAPESSLMP